LKNLSNLEKNISKYVLKNTPKNLPNVSMYIKNYIRALLGSNLIEESFNKLDSYFSSGFRVYGEKFNEDRQEWEPNWVEDPSLHFVLRDFCSVVGFVYKPEYKDVILRSFVSKDMSFFSWFFSSYLSLPVINMEVLRSGSVLTISHTDEGGFTDSDLLTDLSVSGYLSLNVYFNVSDQEEVSSRLDSCKDLLSLIVPARLFVDFLYI